MQAPTDYPNHELYDRLSPLLTDKYQLTMAYSYWRQLLRRQTLNPNAVDKHGVFHMYFRNGPFDGEFCVFAGLDRALSVLENLKFTENDIVRLKPILGPVDFADDFFSYLLGLNFGELVVKSVVHGEIVFPNVPVMTIEGPLIMGQLVETILLNAVSFPTLVATNAARIVMAAEGKRCVEFGFRRAQGPDGGMTATKYSQVGGFDGTSNVLGASLYGIKCVGTNSHSYMMSCTSLDDVISCELQNTKTNLNANFKELVLKTREELGYTSSNDAELAAFINYAMDFPNNFMALLDTYDTLTSGLLNYISVALALYKLGFIPLGVRMDSGNLACLSKEIRAEFKRVDALYNTNVLTNSTIFASNELSEQQILSLFKEGHEIDVFAVGTNLVVCSKKPALGMVYKLVEIDGIPRIKFSQDPSKSTLPYDKNAFRFYNESGIATVDFMTRREDVNSLANHKGEILCKHPTDQKIRAITKPTKVEKLLSVVWADNKVVPNDYSIHAAKDYCKMRLSTIRPDHLRFSQPTPAKVSIDSELFNETQRLHDENSTDGLIK